MRLGPVAYDVVSLLYDPYVDLPADERRTLRDELLASFPVGGRPRETGARPRQVEAMTLTAGCSG